MRFGLKNKDISKIQSVFSSFPEVKKAILYGSRAMGRFRKGSDIDMTLKGNHLNYDLLSKISLQLDDLLLPYFIDLSLYDYIDNEDLKLHIRQVGKTFYSRPQ